MIMSQAKILFYLQKLTLVLRCKYGGKPTDLYFSRHNGHTKTNIVVEHGIHANIRFAAESNRTIRLRVTTKRPTTGRYPFSIRQIGHAYKKTVIMYRVHVEVFDEK